MIRRRARHGLARSSEETNSLSKEVRIFAPFAVLVTVLGLLALTPDVGNASGPEKPDKAECEDKRDKDHHAEEDPECESEGPGQLYGEGGDDGASLPHPEDGNSHTTKANDGHIVHWTKPSADERKIIIRNHTVDSWATKLPNAISDWGASSKFKFSIQQGATDTTTRESCSMPNLYGRVKVCSYHYTWSDAGRARIQFNHTDGGRHHIQQAWVKLNGRTTTTDQERSVICHEVGHALGLDHRGATSSCMYNGSTFPTSPDQHDYDVLVAQTHSHGGESSTGGTFEDLNTGGGLEDGCGVCVEVEQARNGNHIVTFRFHYQAAKAASPALHPLL